MAANVSTTRGHWNSFGNEGISPSNLKIKAILGLPDPKNESEVRSLLGMTNFCGAEFIPNYATLTYCHVIAHGDDRGKTNTILPLN